MSTGWQWPITPAPKTPGTAHRFLMGVFPLHPLPGGGPKNFGVRLDDGTRVCVPGGHLQEVKTCRERIATTPS